MTDQQESGKAAKPSEPFAADVGGLFVTVVTAFQPYFYFSIVILVVSGIVLAVSALAPSFLPNALRRHRLRVAIYSVAVVLLSGVPVFGSSRSDLPESAIDVLRGIRENTGHLSQGVDRANETLGDIDKKMDNVGKETSDDPRKEIANLGMHWSRDDFISAVRDGDTRGVLLFQAGGMKLDKSGLWGFLVDFEPGETGLPDAFLFNDDVAKALLVHKGVAADACRFEDTLIDHLTDKEFNSFYENPQRVEFIKELCGAELLRKNLDAAIDTKSELMSREKAAADDSIAFRKANPYAPLGLSFNSPELVYNRLQREVERLKKLRNSI
ncbi:MAG: hypothetical protein WDN01_21840 [Rhizomicrobium sp.]